MPKGPISDPKDLAAAYKRGIERVKNGEPALIDVVTHREDETVSGTFKILLALILGAAIAEAQPPTETLPEASSYTTKSICAAPATAFPARMGWARGWFP